jgi:hypothetical protein
MAGMYQCVMCRCCFFCSGPLADRRAFARHSRVRSRLHQGPDHRVRGQHCAHAQLQCASARAGEVATGQGRGDGGRQWQLVVVVLSWFCRRGDSVSVCGKWRRLSVGACAPFVALGERNQSAIYLGDSGNSVYITGAEQDVRAVEASAIMIDESVRQGLRSSMAISSSIECTTKGNHEQRTEHPSKVHSKVDCSCCIDPAEPDD